MADELPEREDPVLVRPYITTEPGEGSAVGRDDRYAETWPESATLPDDHTREMTVVPAPAPERDPAARTSALLRQRLIVLAGIGALALVAVVAFVVFGPPNDDDPPPTARPTLAAPSVTGALGAAPAASATARSTRPSGRSSRSSAAGANPARNGTPSPRDTTGQATKPTPSSTLAPPPDPARTGAITAAGGRCLTRGGILALDGSPVQTAFCTGGSSQQWTMASDGTLIVEDKCAQVSAGGTVRIGACDDSPAAQWRAGPNGSLVNPETGRCLTDPDTAGATTEVAACTGAADQRWKLP
jgi:hypothetical protein